MYFVKYIFYHTWLKFQYHSGQSTYFLYLNTLQQILYLTLQNSENIVFSLPLIADYYKYFIAESTILSSMFIDFIHSRQKDRVEKPWQLKT